MQAIDTHVLMQHGLSVCLRVSHDCEPVETAETMKMPFWGGLLSARILDGGTYWHYLVNTIE